MLNKVKIPTCTFWRYCVTSKNGGFIYNVELQQSVKVHFVLWIDISFGEVPAYQIPVKYGTGERNQMKNVLAGIQYRGKLEYQQFAK